MPPSDITGKIVTAQMAVAEKVAKTNPWVTFAVILTMLGGLVTQTKILLAKAESAEQKADSANVAVARIEGMVTAMYQMQMALNTKANLPVVEAKAPPAKDTVIVPVIIPAETSAVDTMGNRPR